MTSTSRESTESRPIGRDARRLLAVDFPVEYRGAVPRRLVDEAFDDVRFVKYAELSREVYLFHKPDTIIAPLLTRAFDAVELAEYLATLEYRGLLIIVSEMLPNASIVKREIARSAPGVSLELFELKANPGLRGV